MLNMNSYELAILRILVKRHTPIKIPDLISGFPDNSEFSVLDAIYRLHSLGYVSINDRTHYQRYLLLTKEKKKEAVEIVSSNIGNGTQTRDKFYEKQIINPSIKNKSGTAKTLLLAMMGITAFSILLSGLAIVLVNSQPLSSANLNPSHDISMDRSSPLLISTYTNTGTPRDQSTGLASTPELTDPFVLVRLGSLDEQPTQVMVDEGFTADPNSEIIPTIFFKIGTHAEMKSDDTNYHKVI
jgi:hypothetical protein